MDHLYNYPTVNIGCRRFNRIILVGNEKRLASNLFFAQVNPTTPSMRDAITPSVVLQPDI